MPHSDKQSADEQVASVDGSSSSGHTVWIGLDLGGTTIQGGLVEAGGHLLTTRMLSTPRSGTAQDVLKSLVDFAAALKTEALERCCHPAALGVGTPGAVDPTTGTILGAAPNLPQWVGIELRAPLEEALGLPAALDNDANMAALGEGAFGAAKGCQHFVCLTLGTGIGAGIVLDGKIVRGSGFAAGEAGHMIIHEGGMRCACGSRGCLEAHASGGALVRMMEAVAGKPAERSFDSGDSRGHFSAEDVFRAAADGDQVARELVREVAVHLGAGIASIVSLVDPQRVVLSGGVAEAGEDFLAAVRAAAVRRLMPVFAERLSIVKGRLGRWAGVLGAGAAAIRLTGTLRPNRLSRGTA